MSKSQSLRALVSERLMTAAEDIFALVERAIAEYEEELSRSKEENQKKQEILEDLLLNQQVLVHRTDVQIQTEPSMKPGIPETPQIKVETHEQSSVKHEVLQRSPFTAVSVKNEELELQQRQTKHRQEKQEEEEQVDNSSDADDDEDWEPPASSSTVQMETEMEREDDYQVQIKDTNTAAHNSTLFNKSQPAHPKGRHGEPWRRHECPMCQRLFTAKHSLDAHLRIHTGERPHRCLVCNKAFTQKSNLSLHEKLHTGERPYSCPNCHKTFSRKGNLEAHMRIYTGEKPYRCSVCDRGFTRNSTLVKHLKTHGDSVRLQLFNLHQNIFE